MTATCFIVALSLRITLSASTIVVDEADVPPSMILSSAAVEVTPKVTNCAAALASSNNAFPAAVRSYVAAVPDPVNCIPLSAAEVNPAIAASSASLA